MPHQRVQKIANKPPAVPPRLRPVNAATSKARSEKPYAATLKALSDACVGVDVALARMNATMAELKGFRFENEESGTTVEEHTIKPADLLRSILAGAEACMPQQTTVVEQQRIAMLQHTYQTLRRAHHGVFEHKYLRVKSVFRENHIACDNSICAVLCCRERNRASIDSVLTAETIDDLTPVDDSGCANTSPTFHGWLALHDAIDAVVRRLLVKTAGNDADFWLEITAHAGVRLKRIPVTD